MNRTALRRALTNFTKPEPPKRQCNATPPKPDSRQRCFEFGPDLLNYPSIHAVCSLKKHHGGYHYDEEYGIQWDAATVAWNPEFLEKQAAKLSAIGELHMKHCPQCHKGMTETTENMVYHFINGRNVILINTKVFNCPCGEKISSVPNIIRLHEAIVQNINATRFEFRENSWHEHTIEEDIQHTIEDIKNTLFPTKRTAISPKELLIKEFIEPLGLDKVAELLDMTTEGVTQLTNRPISPAVANILALGLGTTPEFWTNLQEAYDRSFIPTEYRGKQ